VVALVVVVCATGLAQTSPRTVWEGVYAADQAEHGKEQYMTSCAACHGGSLEGQGMAGALRGETFMRSWSGRSAYDLFLRVSTTMPADDPTSLDEDEYVSILAYVLQENAFPSGATMLTKDSALLKSITITRSKD
jgi:mono/diheme cytochrome c family protein